MYSKNIKKGTIIVARPSLINNIFYRTVILIVEHDTNGTVGFILNKSLDLPINIFSKEIEDKYNVYNGGPVEQKNVYYLHKRPDLIQNSIHIIDNIYWSGNFDDLKKEMKNNTIQDHEIRFFIGYCGWSVNQLSEEIEDNNWEILNDFKVDIFLKWDNNLWITCLKKLGGENLLWINTPSDPSLN